MGLYIETLVGADIERLWSRAQEPAQHQRWDLRFTRIAYLPRVDGEAQRFTYAVRVLPGVEISGTGVTAGERSRPDGTRTSALRFGSEHPLTPIVSGRGYWRYVPDGDGVRFLTGYDYTPRWKLVDRLLVRPLMGWGTAWSFDRLRLWCERDLSPERALLHAVAEVVVRVAAVVVALAGGPLLALAVSAAAVLVPPLPTTPAARRCLRRPPSPVTAPSVLTTLESS